MIHYFYNFFITAMEQIIVYIDGACANNGQKNARAGYGVYFTQDDPRNEYGPVSGKQTNNTGELTAFVRCLEILSKDIANGTKVHIHTDSEYVIKCVTSYGEKLERKEWKTSKDKDPPNLELLQKAYALYKGTKQLVSLHKVRAHTGNTDEHSKGNEGADRLANMGAGKSEDAEHSIIKLTIAFNDKDKAKALGAKWDMAHKYWYINTKYVDEDAKNQLLALQSNNETIPVKKDSRDSSDGEKNKKYIKISYANKNKAKSLGARWDASVKSWYYLEESLSSKQIDDLLHLQ
jgi:ribonuclease HI